MTRKKLRLAPLPAPSKGMPEYIKTCFGRGEPQRGCPCPPACKALCSLYPLDETMRPRKCHGLATNPRLPSDSRGYTSFWNVILNPYWGYPPELEPRIYAKWLLLFLTRLGGEERWVWSRPARLAERLGWPLKTVMNYLRALQAAGLVVLLPRSSMDSRSTGRWKTVVLLDMPPGFGEAIDLHALAARLSRLASIVGRHLERHATRALTLASTKEAGPAMDEEEAATAEGEEPHEL